MSEYNGPDRRSREFRLSEHEMEAIAERAADRALEKVYAIVGRSAVTRLFWLVGVVVLGLVGWLGWHGKLPTP